MLPAVLAGGLLFINLMSPLHSLVSALPAGFMALIVFYNQVRARKAWVKRALGLSGGINKFRFDDCGFSVELSLRQHTEPDDDVDSSSER